MGLNDLKVKSLKPKEKLYRVSDEKGLLLEVTPSGSKLWRYRYKVNGKSTMISLGGYPGVSLLEARIKAQDERSKRQKGIDPSTERKKEKTESKSTGILFADIFKQWHKVNYARRNQENAEAVYRRMELDILPYLGKRPIADITAAEVLKVLKMVEERGALETASRLRGWTSNVFDLAVAQDIRDNNPAVRLSKSLTPPATKHFATFTDPDKIKQFFRSVKSYQGGVIVRAAMEFGVLTFVRPGNLREAEWSEIDLDGKTPQWIIPADKMKIKTGKDFIVPLCPRSVEILRNIKPLTESSRYVFPTPRNFTRPLSENGVQVAYKAMGYASTDIVPHGVRAMARTICHEVLGFAPEVIEEQLAHIKSGALRDAYDRTQHLPERRRLMKEWAEWLENLIK